MKEYVPLHASCEATRGHGLPAVGANDLGLPGPDREGWDSNP